MVGYLDPKEWSGPVTFSNHWLGETCVIEMPRTAKPLLLEATKPYESAILGPHGFPVVGDATKRTRGYVDVKSLAPFLTPQVPDFLTRYYAHKSMIPVIDGGQLNLSLIQDTKDVDFTTRPLRADVGQITAGNFTVGPAGGDDYPIFGGVGGSWAACGNLTGAMTHTNTGAIVENAQALIAITLNNFVFDNTSNNPHNGDPTGGHLITITAAANTFSVRVDGPGTFNIRNLRTVRTAANNVDIEITNNAVQSNINLHDLMMDHGGFSVMCIAVIDNTPIVYVWNCVFWNAGAPAGRGLDSIAGNAANIYENNDSYSCWVGYDVGGQPGTWRNNAAWNNALDFAVMGAATGRFNLSSDATATGGWLAEAGNIINTPALNCVQSVNPALAIFMDILVGGAFVGAGEANGIAARTVCIRNRAVPGPTGTSIGAAEEITPIPPTPTPTAAKICVPSRVTQSGISMGIGI
jgi:hypothetical protein